MTTKNAGFKPKDVIDFAKEQGAKFVDLKFIDLPGHLAAHPRSPSTRLNDDLFEEGIGFDGSSVRGWQPINASDMNMTPDPSTAARIDPFYAQKHAEHDLQDQRPRHRAGLRPRPALHRPEGREPRQGERHRRHHRTSAPRPSSSSSTRSDTTAPRAAPSTRDRRRRGRSGTAASRRPEPRPQDPSEGGVFPRPADRPAR